MAGKKGQPATVESGAGAQQEIAAGDEQGGEERAQEPAPRDDAPELSSDASDVTVSEPPVVDSAGATSDDQEAASASVGDLEGGVAVSEDHEAESTSTGDLDRGGVAVDAPEAGTADEARSTELGSVVAGQSASDDGTAESGGGAAEVPSATVTSDSDTEVDDDSEVESSSATATAAENDVAPTGDATDTDSDSDAADVEVDVETVTEAVESPVAGEGDDAEPDSEPGSVAESDEDAGGAAESVAAGEPDSAEPAGADVEVAESAGTEVEADSDGAGESVGELDVDVDSGGDVSDVVVASELSEPDEAAVPGLELPTEVGGSEPVGDESDKAGVAASEPGAPEPPTADPGAAEVGEPETLTEVTAAESESADSTEVVSASGVVEVGESDPVVAADADVTAVVPSVEASEAEPAAEASGEIADGGAATAAEPVSETTEVAGDADSPTGAPATSAVDAVETAEPETAAEPATAGEAGLAGGLPAAGERMQIDAPVTAEVAAVDLTPSTERPPPESAGPAVEDASEDADAETAVGSKGPPPGPADVTVEPSGRAPVVGPPAPTVEPPAEARTVGPPAPTVEPPAEARTVGPPAPTVEPSGRAPTVEPPAPAGRGAVAEPVPEVTPRHLRRGPESVPEVAPRHLRLSSSPRLRQLGRKLRLREGPDGKLQLTPEAALVMVPLVVVALVGVLVMAWTVDSFIHAGQVQRNVTVAGSAVGGQPEATLAAEVAEVADAAGQRTVTVVVDGEPVDDVDAVDLGLALDEEAAVEGAMDAGRGSLLAQPFSWSRSLFNDHEVPLDYTVDEAELTNSLGMLYLAGIGDAADVVAFQNPRIDLTDGEFVLVPGQPGSGLDLDRASADLATAAGSTDGPFDDIVLDVETDELAPSITDEQAQALVDEANSLTEGGLAVVAEDVEGSSSSEQTLSAEQLRSWITPVLEPAEAGEIEGVDPDELEELSLHFDTAAAGEAVAELFAEIGEEPTNATVALTDGSIEVVESQSGVACCAGDAGAQVWSALNDGEGELTVEAEVVEPEITTEDAEGWGIVEPVGGSRGWQAGAEVEQGPRPGYTTWEVGGGGRAHNIETIVGEINGAVILPGETWSINDYVGARECPPYQAAGAIVEGEHEDVCGGGISQVGTTLLNAAYFAGLDVTGQAHSEYFSRYPQGREATMGAPGTPLDVTIENTTPYGIYIQAARHGDEVTFTIWSTEHIVVEDLGVDQMGTCITVTNTRQRTFPDGRVETDQFTAVYRPGEGIQC